MFFLILKKSQIIFCLGTFTYLIPWVTHCSWICVYSINLSIFSLDKYFLITLQWLQHQDFSGFSPSVLTKMFVKLSIFCFSSSLFLASLAVSQAEILLDFLGSCRVFWLSDWSHRHSHCLFSYCHYSPRAWMNASLSASWVTTALTVSVLRNLQCNQDNLITAKLNQTTFLVKYKYGNSWELRSFGQRVNPFTEVSWHSL